MKGKEIEIAPFGNLLVYQPGYTVSFMEEAIRTHGLSGLRIWGYTQAGPPTDIRFLADCGFLEALDVTSGIDYDFEFLKSLPNLKRLWINTQGKTVIDLSSQRALEYLAIEWRKGKIEGLEECVKLSSLGLIDYGEKDLTPIRNLRALEHLRIKTASIVSLDGAEELHSLEKLLLGNCRKLTSIRLINGKKGLVSLEVESCKRIADWNGVGDLPHLEYLRLTNCGTIYATPFEMTFPSLKKFVVNGDTKITAPPDVVG